MVSEVLQLLFIELAVIGVGHNAPGVHGFEGKQYLGHEPVVIAFDIEDLATLPDVIRRGKVSQ